MSTDPITTVTARCACGSVYGWIWGFAPPPCPGCGHRLSNADMAAMREDLERIRDHEAAQERKEGAKP